MLMLKFPIGFFFFWINKFSIGYIRFSSQTLIIRMIDMYCRSKFGNKHSCRLGSLYMSRQKLTR